MSPLKKHHRRNGKMTKNWRSLFFLSCYLILTVILTACAGQPERLWLKPPGWSRAQLLGNTRVGDPVPVTYDGDGQTYIFLMSPGMGASHPRVLSLDGQAKTVWDRTYEEIELAVSKEPRMLWDGDVLQLFWIAGNGLYNLQLDASGNLLGPPKLLSGKTTVGHYDVASNTSGSIAIWYAGTRDEPGLYALPPGDLTGEATLVDPEGIRPSLQYDDTGTLHVIWTRDPSGGGSKPYLYAAYPDSTYPPGAETIVVAPRVIGTTVLDGPHLGLDREHVYILWSMTFFSGLDAGTSKAYYAYFQKGRPSSVSPVNQLFVPYAYDLIYEAMPDSDLKAGERVYLSPEFRGGSNYIIAMKTNPTADQELVVVLQARQAYLMRQTRSQVSAVFFQDGAPTAYQQLSFTPSSPTSPAIISDDEGRLSLTWLEKGELPGWAVYFASTAPDIREALSNITRDDFGRLTAETLFGLLSSAVLIPFALAWLLPAILVLALTSRIREAHDRLASPGVIVSLSLTFIVYFISKLGTLPEMRSYLPFSAWIPFIPPWLYFPLRLGVPLLSAGLALLVAWFYTYRKMKNSIFLFLAIFAIVDGLITMAVYGVLVYGAF